MNYEETDALLKNHGFTLNCFSPLEITSEDDGSTASGICAECILEWCKKIDEEQKNDQEYGLGGS